MHSCRVCAASTGQHACPEPSDQPCSKVLARELGSPTFNLNIPFLWWRVGEKREGGLVCIVFS